MWPGRSLVLILHQLFFISKCVHCSINSSPESSTSSSSLDSTIQHTHSGALGTPDFISLSPLDLKRAGKSQCQVEETNAMKSRQRNIRDSHTALMKLGIIPDESIDNHRKGWAMLQSLHDKEQPSRLAEIDISDDCRISEEELLRNERRTDMDARVDIMVLKIFLRDVHGFTGDFDDRPDDFMFDSSLLDTSDIPMEILDSDIFHLKIQRIWPWWHSEIAAGRIRFHHPEGDLEIRRRNVFNRICYFYRKGTGQGAPRTFSEINWDNLDKTIFPFHEAPFRFSIDSVEDLRAMERALSLHPHIKFLKPDSSELMKATVYTHIYKLYCEAYNQPEGRLIKHLPNSHIIFWDHVKVTGWPSRVSKDPSFWKREQLEALQMAFLMNQIHFQYNTSIEYQGEDRMSYSDIENDKVCAEAATELWRAKKALIKQNSISPMKASASPKQKSGRSRSFSSPKAAEKPSSGSAKKQAALKGSNDSDDDFLQGKGSDSEHISSFPKESKRRSRRIIYDSSSDDEVQEGKMEVIANPTVSQPTETAACPIAPINAKFDKVLSILLPLAQVSTAQPFRLQVLFNELFYAITVLKSSLGQENSQLDFLLLFCHLHILAIDDFQKAGVLPASSARDITIYRLFMLCYKQGFELINNRPNFDALSVIPKFAFLKGSPLSWDLQILEDALDHNEQIFFNK